MRSMAITKYETNTQIPTWSREKHEPYKVEGLRSSKVHTHWVS